MKFFLRGILASTALCALAQANAATTPNSVVSPQTPNRGIVQFLQGTDAPLTFKTIYTAGANGSRCYGMTSNNSDGSVGHSLITTVTNGGINYGGAAITTTTNAGLVAANPPQAMLTPAVWPGLAVDTYGNPYIQLISGDTLRAEYATALTAAAAINIIVTCNDF